MRKAWFAFIAVVALAAPLVASTGPAVGVPLVDVSVTGASVPESVSPLGGVLYQITIRNNGAVPAVDVTLTDTTTGAAVKEVTPGPGLICTGTNPVKCSVLTLLPGGALTLEVAAKANPGVSEVVNTATVSTTVPPVDEVPANNTSVVTTPVDPSISRALLFPGEKLSKGRHTFTAPQGGAGVLVELKENVLNQDSRPHVQILFPEHSKYHALNPADPGRFDMSFLQPPCNGLGAPKCLPLTVALDINEPWEAVERCAGSTAPNKPGPGGLSPLQTKCLDYVDKVQGAIYYHVKMLSKDPIFGIGEVGGVAL